MIRASRVPQADPAFVPFRLVALGASAGGIPALHQLLSKLPQSFPLPIVLLQHLSTHFPSRLPEILALRTRLRCKWAEEGELPRPGTVHVAVPGTNLVFERTGVLAYRRGPKPPLGWPSIDLFLRSMAESVGEAGIAVVLSGMLRDGADGIAAVRRAGGATMVQDPRSAGYPDMPTAAVDLGRADLVLGVDRIAEALQILAEYGMQ